MLMTDMQPIFQNLTPPPSLKEMAFQTIKESIISHKLECKAIYSEQAIAKELGISKTPVHQALTDLESRGFVKVLPRRGFQVNHLTKKDVEDMFRFRLSLERTVIFLITAELTDDSIKRLEDFNRRAAQTRDRFQYLKHDRDFHLYLAFLTQNRFIIDALDNIKDLCDWVGAEVFGLDHRPDEVIREHAAVIDMLKKKDPEAAAAAMEEHLQITERSYFNEMSEKTKGQG